MAFNPGSFSGTQNAGPKPKVIAHDWLSSNGSPLSAGGSYTSLYSATLANPTPPTPVSVVEGEHAIATFWFVDPNNGNPYDSWQTDLVELRDTATFNLSWDGASLADVTGGLEYLTFFSTTGAASGGVWGAWSAVTGGSVTLNDALDTDPNVGTKVYAIAVKLNIKQDAIVENGEQVLFKFTQSSSTKFTDSNYVEARINIADYVVPAVNVATGTTATTANQDVFNVTGTVNSFGTIGAGFGTGDKLKVDIAPTGGTTPNLSMVNFGVLTGVGITSEPLLINGLRALNDTDCNQGGLYMMGVGSDTYIIFDSTNNGKLDTDGSGTDDVFVKLVGINPHSLQSTHFELV